LHHGCAARPPLPPTRAKRRFSFKTRNPQTEKPQTRSGESAKHAKGPEREKKRAWTTEDTEDTDKAASGFQPQCLLLLSVRSVLSVVKCFFWVAFRVLSRVSRTLSFFGFWISLLTDSEFRGVVRTPVMRPLPLHRATPSSGGSPRSATPPSSSCGWRLRGCGRRRECPARRRTSHRTPAPRSPRRPGSHR